MRILSIALIIFALTFIVIGSDLSERDSSLGIERDIFNFTEHTINLSSTRDIIKKVFIENYTEVSDETIINVNRIKKITGEGVDFLIVALQEGIKMIVEIGYKKPLDYHQIFNLVKYIFILIVIITLLKPMGYLIVFLIMLILYIKDKSKSKINKK
jgi:hypothetical protein